jgi:RNA polymerase-binding protein DksA
MNREQIRAVLTEAAAAAQARFATLDAELQDVAEAAAGSNLDDEHDPEGSTIAFEREQLAALRDQARAQLDEVREALHRLDVGRYGICERCGTAIAAERLVARPTARFCVNCASERR